MRAETRPRRSRRRRGRLTTNAAEWRKAL
jgi:hypothetical protein